jgi:preprotein translocase subunit SecG
MFTFLLVVHVIISAALVGVILMQRSEGGGLTGGSPSGLMSARGAGDFLTRATAILAGLFVLMSLALATLATMQGGPSKIDESLSRKAGSAAPVSTTTLPAATGGEPSTANSVAPTTDASPVPLAVPETPPAALPVTKTAVPASKTLERLVPEAAAPKPSAKIEVPKPAPLMKKSLAPAPVIRPTEPTQVPTPAPKPADGGTVVPPGLIPDTK